MTYPLLKLEDQNTKCGSYLATISLGDYLGLVESAYSDQGGISGQRAPIRTKTALKIRNRLVQDLRNGAVIPPVVVGVVCSPALRQTIGSLTTSDEMVAALRQDKAVLSIIDGMQRTTALKEAFEDPGQSCQPIRVEIWAAEKVSSLIYRMLVLNTGQVPWDLKRQLDTLYRPIISEVQSQLPNFRIITLDEGNRRPQAGEYRSTRIAELFLAFTSRSTDIDIKEKVAEEFVRVDLAEATASDAFLPIFIRALGMMEKLDKLFCKVEPEQPETDEHVRVRAGQDIFKSSPGSIGFVVAIAEVALGAPGFDYDMEKAGAEMSLLETKLDSLTAFADGLGSAELCDFVDLATLNQWLSIKSGKVGDYERGYYKRAFATLFALSDDIVNRATMTPCWAAR